MPIIIPVNSEDSVQTADEKVHLSLHCLQILLGLSSFLLERECTVYTCKCIKMGCCFRRRTGYTLGKFAAIFIRYATSVTSCLLSCTLSSFSKVVYFKRKEFAP